MASLVNSWFAFVKPNLAADIRLFCFPYAGGSAMTYRTWSDLLPKNIEVYPVELPGRGSRMREQPYTNMTPLVHDLGLALKPYLDKPYAFWGHSMGALIGFELARLFRRWQLPGPMQLFASGHTAPQVKSSHQPIYNLPEREFLVELRQLEGTPEAVLNNQELMQLLIPMLRADFEVNETYRYDPEPPLACPITVYGGANDRDVNREALEAWREQTSADFALHIF
ncbi:MAG: alpha/beta fold hydrolase, partial [candidate division KSB1 bacterium]|nr:alpha/beta fold hydrolase [candidate division KSB1 bacterium]